MDGVNKEVLYDLILSDIFKSESALIGNGYRMKAIGQAMEE